MEYQIIQVRRHNGIKTLIQMVNEMISCGWEIQGGICSDDYFYMQAIVKKKEDKK